MVFINKNPIVTSLQFIFPPLISLCIWPLHHSLAMANVKTWYKINAPSVQFTVEFLWDVSTVSCFQKCWLFFTHLLSCFHKALLFPFVLQVTPFQGAKSETV